MTEMPCPGIRVLDGETVNRIAAGEVVERPASIVKELIENAIDARAGLITVEIGTDGKEISSIRISDDGVGIPPEEVLLAFQPHATSKIRTAGDLDSCLTLGFRGEALASIAAIATVTMVTRTRNADAGFRITISGGQVTDQGETGAPPGTSLVIGEIFFTTPARRKFLRSLATELARISSVIEVFSLIYPAVTFRYVLNGQEKSASHGGRTLGEVLRSLRPAEADGMIPFRCEEGGIRLDGYISHPSLFRQTPQRILLAVNGRVITSSRITGAIRSGYGTLIPSHSYPVVVLMITLDPSRIDANIHPTKREIRVSGEPALLRVITNAVRKTLQGLNLSHPAPAEHTATLFDETGSSGPAPTRYPAPDTPSRRVCEATLAGYRTTTRQLRQTRITDAPDHPVHPAFPALEYIGQVAATYLLASSGSGDLVLLDQHAAHERVRYDQLKQQQEQGCPSQELIVPVVLSLTRPEHDLLAAQIPLLAEEGFIIEPFGGDTWCVRGVPVILGRCEDPEAIREIITGALDAGSDTRLSESVSRLVACRSAVKAGAILTHDQGEEIIRQLSRTREPYTCPHGRPTMVRFSRERLEELFRRR